MPSSCSCRRKGPARDGSIHDTCSCSRADECGHSCSHRLYLPQAFTFLAPENVSEDVAATSGNAFEIAEMSYLFVRDSASRRDVLHDLALARDFPEATAPQETDSRFPFLEYSGSESQARKRQSLMLVPLGAEPPAAIPEVISAKHVYGWYSVTLLLAGLATAQITAGDAFAGGSHSNTPCAYASSET